MAKLKQRQGRWVVESDEGIRPATDLEVEQTLKIEALEAAITDTGIQTFHQGYSSGWKVGRDYEATQLAQSLGQVRDLLWRLADGGLKNLDPNQRRELQETLAAIGLTRSN